MRLTHRKSRRRGAVAPLMAVLLVPMVAMVAFTIDIGRITMTTAEIQNSADAAALAGADQLEKGYAYYLFYKDASNLSTYETNAKTNAKTICSLHNNTDLASIKLRGADIEFGYTDSSYTYYTGSAGSLDQVRLSSQKCRDLKQITHLSHRLRLVTLMYVRRHGEAGSSPH